MTLTGSQIEQIHSALLSAYNKQDLELMLKFELTEDLDTIVGGDDTYSKLVLNLVSWAERHNRVSDLINGAVKRNPKNEGLKKLVGDYHRWQDGEIEEESTIDIHPPAKQSQGDESTTKQSGMEVTMGNAGCLNLLGDLGGTTEVPTPWGIFKAPLGIVIMGLAGIMAGYLIALTLIIPKNMPTYLAEPLIEAALTAQPTATKQPYLNVKGDKNLQGEQICVELGETVILEIANPPATSPENIIWRTSSVALQNHSDWEKKIVSPEVKEVFNVIVCQDIAGDCRPIDFMHFSVNERCP